MRIQFHKENKFSSVCPHYILKRNKKFALCVSCLYMGCVGEHLQSHYEEEGHAISLGVNESHSYAVFCAICKSFDPLTKVTIDEKSALKEIYKIASKVKDRFAKEQSARSKDLTNARLNRINTLFNTTNYEGPSLESLKKNYPILEDNDSISYLTVINVLSSSIPKTIVFPELASFTKKLLQSVKNNTKKPNMVRFNEKISQHSGALKYYSESGLKTLIKRVYEPKMERTNSKEKNFE